MKENLHDEIEFQINSIWQRFGRPPTIIRISSKYLKQLKSEMSGVIGANLTDGILEYNGIEIIEDLNDDDVIKCYIG